MSFLLPRLTRQICFRAPAYMRTVALNQRALHVSAFVNAKKKIDEDDPFVEEDETEELFTLDTSPKPRDSESSVFRSPHPKSKQPPKPVKHNREFRKFYQILTKQLAPETTAAERRAINCKGVRRLITACRDAEEFAMTAEIVGKWAAERRASEETVERLLGPAYWILKQGTPKKEVKEGAEDAEPASAPAVEEDPDDLFSASTHESVDLTTMTKGERRRLRHAEMETNLQTPIGRHRAKFYALYEQLMTRIPTKDALLAPRKSLLALIQYSKQGEDLKKVAEVLKLWREHIGPPDRAVIDQILGRCCSLLEAPFAVELLSQREIYGMDVPTAKHQHTLFQSILRVTKKNPQASLEAAFKLASMASALPSRHILQDPVNASLLIAICDRAGHNGSVMKGNQVLDELKAYLEARRRPMTDEEREQYKKVGFVNRPRRLRLSEAEKVWKEKSIETTRRFAQKLGIDLDFLNDMPDNPPPHEVAA